MVCKNCGKENIDTIEKCIYCKSELNISNFQSKTQLENKKEKEKKITVEKENSSKNNGGVSFNQGLIIVILSVALTILQYNNFQIGSDESNLESFVDFFFKLFSFPVSIMIKIAIFYAIVLLFNKNSKKNMEVNKTETNKESNQKIICSACNKEISQDDKYCIYCGKENLNCVSRIINQSNDNKNNELIESNNYDLNKQKSMKFLRTIFLIITVMLIILAIHVVSESCDGLDCLGPAFKFIFIIFGISSLWIIYGIVKVIKDLNNTNKLSPNLKKFKKYFICFGIIPSLFLFVMVIVSNVFFLGTGLLTSIMYLPSFGVPLIAIYFGMKNFLVEREKGKTSVAGIIIMVIFIPSFVSACISSCVSFYNEIKDSSVFKNYDLSDMIENICSGPYEKIYSINNYKKSGIFECSNNKYSYYIEGNNEQCGYYDCGKIYEIGYSYHPKIEEQFKNGIYFYRESTVSSYPSELKILVEAVSEEDLINRYAEKLYNLDKDKNLDIVVYYNETLSEINDTYDKLGLQVFHYTVNVTQFGSMGTEYGKYAMYYGDPDETFNELFSDKKNYPETMRNAIKFHRHILFENDGKNFNNLSEFTELLRNSFEEGF